MRNLFIVAAKLLGLLQLFAALAYVTQSAFALGVYRAWVEAQLSIYSSSMFAVWGIFILLSFSLAWVLVAQTEWLADRLRIRGDQESADLSDSRILRIGVKLLGFFFIASSLPYLGSSLVRAIYESHGGSPASSSFPLLLASLIPLIQLVLALFFLFDTDRVVANIGRCRRPVEKQSETEEPPSIEEPMD